MNQLLQESSVQRSDWASGKAAGTSLTSPAPAGVSLSEVLTRCATAVQRSFPVGLWVRIEISTIKLIKGHYYIEAVERSPEDGRQLAKASAQIWASHLATITAKFKDATGMDMAAGIAVLVWTQPTITPQYGLALKITDVDPRFTLGDMEAKLKRIRETIDADGIADKNRTLPSPTDFFRVGVISPAGAAGLQDFQVGASVLTKAGLCEFQYFAALFQGEHTQGSICAAIEAAHAAHVLKPLDALVIIRGGGAAADLHWLAELPIVRRICRFHCPVLTGIGHERDKSILDEYSNRAFGTPSKVIAFIRDAILAKAQQGHENWQTLTRVVTSRLDIAQAKIDVERTKVETGILNQLTKSETTSASLMTAVRSSANVRLDRAQAASILADQSIAADAFAAVDLAETKIAHAYVTINERAHVHLAKAASTSENAYQSITLAAQRSIDGIDGHMQELLASVRSSVASRATNYEAAMQRHAQDTRLRARQRLDQAERENQHLIAGIMSHGVEPTLRRGFALVRNADGPVSTKAKALASSELQIDFRDGTITLIHQPH